MTDVLKVFLEEEIKKFKPLLIWKNHKDLIRPGEKAFLNNIPVGFVAPHRGKFKATCSLPVTRKTCGYYASAESAKEAIRKTVLLWLMAAGLKVIE